MIEYDENELVDVLDSSNDYLTVVCVELSRLVRFETKGHKLFILLDNDTNTWLNSEDLVVYHDGEVSDLDEFEKFLDEVKEMRLVKQMFK